ncbi:MAG: GGDEF domain-containing protein [Bryobacterales bacterium]|nr:GGDEF domain-containing protein [Bryobacterales bacterium]
MFSLKRSIELDEQRHQREEQGRQLEEAVTCYRSSIQAVRDHALRACPPLAESHSAALLELEAALETEAGRSSLAASLASLRQQLSRFGEEAFQDFQGREDDLRQLVDLLAMATQSFVSHRSESSQEVLQFTGRVEHIAGGSDLAEVRRQLRTQVKGMRQAIETMAQKETALIEHLESELTATRRRLEATEGLVCLDALTGLSNRRSLERQIGARIRRLRLFSLIVLDINNFRTINERYGQEAGDMLLREFAARLANNVRVTDIACRWKGDQFVALLDCAMPDAMVRSRQIHAQMCATYSLSVQRQEVLIDIGVSMALAENRLNEAPEDLVTRVGACLGKNEPA